MAKASWLKTDKTSGSNDATVNVSANEHTGRKIRTTTLTWKAANVENVVRTVSQAGKPEFVEMETSESSQSTGQVVTISGTSNSAKLTFSLGTGNLDVSLPASYVANSVSTANGAAISGDPGANQAYDFSIQITVPANQTTETQSRQIIVTNEAGRTAVCDLTLAGGAAYITIASGTIELDYKGTAVAVAVRSNTNWTVE